MDFARIFARFGISTQHRPVGGSVTLDLHFWRGFTKRAEILSEFSDSSSAGGHGDDADSETHSHHILTSKLFRTGDAPLLGARSSTVNSPRLDALTISDRQHPTGGMA